MKNCLFILVIGLTSCSNQKNIRSELESISNWYLIEFKENEFDTTGVGNWVPEPKFSARLQCSEDSTCLIPELDFYPIESKDYIIKKLTHHLILRLTLYPPSPTIYVDQEYLLLA